MGSGYEISVQEVLRVVAALDGLLSDFRGCTQDASRVNVPSAAYGQVGSAAAGSSASAQQQLVQTLQALATVLQKINERVRASAEGYADGDRRIAGALTQLATAEPVAFRQPTHPAD
jgi:uncharacterized protein YukE